MNPSIKAYGLIMTQLYCLPTIITAYLRGVVVGIDVVVRGSTRRHGPGRLLLQQVLDVGVREGIGLGAHRTRGPRKNCPSTTHTDRAGGTV